jgi:hypothetical protein
MSKVKIAPPPIRAASGSAVPPPPTRLATTSAQRATAVTFAPTKRVAARRDGQASELVSLPDGSFRLRSIEHGTMAPPSGVFNFVRVHGTTRNDAHLYASSQLPHAALAQGKPVIYAGTAKLDLGRLEWWSNYSGTYQPIAEFRGQAKLPVDKFMPWQKLQMGGASMQRGTFTDRTAKAAPESKRETAASERPGVAKPDKVEAARPATAKPSTAAKPISTAASPSPRAAVPSKSSGSAKN